MRPNSSTSSLPDSSYPSLISGPLSQSDGDDSSSSSSSSTKLSIPSDQSVTTHRGLLFLDNTETAQLIRDLFFFYGTKTCGSGEMHSTLCLIKGIPHNSLPPLLFLPQLAVAFSRLLGARISVPFADKLIDPRLHNTTHNKRRPRGEEKRRDADKFPFRVHLPHSRGSPGSQFIRVRSPTLIKCRGEEPKY